jgi:hypothetical protein
MTKRSPSAKKNDRPINKLPNIMNQSAHHIISTIAQTDAEYRQLNTILTEDEAFAESMGLTYDDVFGEPPQEVQDMFECEALGVTISECFPDGAEVSEIAAFGEFEIAAPNGRSLGALWSISNGSFTDGVNIYPNKYQAALARWKMLGAFVTRPQVVVDIKILVAA